MTQNTPPELGDPSGLLRPNPEEAPRLRAVGAPITPAGGTSSDRLRTFLGAAATLTQGGETPAVLADVVRLTAKLVEDGLLQVQSAQGRLLLLAPAYGAVWLRYAPPVGTLGAHVRFYVEPHLGKGHEAPACAHVQLVQQNDQQWSWAGSAVPGLDGTPPSPESLAEVLLRLFSGEII